MFKNYANPKSKIFGVFSSYEEEYNGNSIEYYSEDPELESMVALSAIESHTQPSYKWPTIGDEGERILYILPWAPPSSNIARQLAKDYQISGELKNSKSIG